MTEQPSQRSSQREQASNKQKVSKEVLEQAISSNRSYWPFALAVALSIALIGVIVHWILFAIGLLLAAVAVIAWGLESHS